MSTGGPRWLIVVVGFLGVVGVASSVTYFLREPANLGFLDHPGIVATHVVAGAVYLTLAPFQFVARVRSRHLDYHRRMGRALVVLGTVTGVTALFIGLAIPFSGWPESLLIAIFGSLFVVSLLRAFAHIRAGRVDKHREWMIRAFAIGLAIATQRILFLPPLMLMGDPTFEQIVALSLVAWTTALVLHAVAAEVWIRRTRQPRPAGSDLAPSGRTGTRARTRTPSP